jgi:hypothetical protein
LLRQRFPLSSFTASLSRGGSWYYVSNLPANLDLGTWHVGIEINGTEFARQAFQVTAGGSSAARLSLGSTYVSNGRTTPVDFGTAGPGSSPPEQTFTISNLGSATLSLSNLVLPRGFSLVGSFPSTIAVGGAANFTLQLDTTTAGTAAGMVHFNSNDPNAPGYSFDVKGTISGGNTGAIHGQVYQDVNGDGREDGADSGLVGWTVALIDPGSGSVITTTTTGYNGYYAFLNLAAGTYRVRETPPAGWTQSTHDPVDVVVGSGDIVALPFGVGVYLPTRFTVSAPASAAAGSPFTISVTALDAFGNIAAGYTGTVTFASSDPYPAILPSNYTFTSADNGTHTFEGVSLLTAGMQTLSAQDTANGSLTGSATVGVAAAPADHFLITAPATAVSGMPFDVLVTPLDPYGNTDTNYQGTVTFSTSDTDPGVTLPADYTFTTGDGGDNGVHAFPGGVVLVTVGDQTLTVVDTVNGTISANATITVSSPAAPPGGRASGPRSSTQNVGMTLARSMQSAEQLALLERLFSLPSGEDLPRGMWAG